MGQTAPADDGVPNVAPGERRRQPDRRDRWRGGRRDSDWANRPPDALTRIEQARRWPSLRQWLQSIGQWSYRRSFLSVGLFSREKRQPSTNPRSINDTMRSNSDTR